MDEAERRAIDEAEAQELAAGADGDAAAVAHEGDGEAAQ